MVYWEEGEWVKGPLHGAPMALEANDLLDICRSQKKRGNMPPQPYHLSKVSKLKIISKILQVFNGGTQSDPKIYHEITPHVLQGFGIFVTIALQWNHFLDFLSVREGYKKILQNIAKSSLPSHPYAKIGANKFWSLSDNATPHPLP